MIKIPNITGGAGGITGASSSATNKASFNQRIGNLAFGDNNKGIKSEYLIAGGIVVAVLVTVVLLKR